MNYEVPQNLINDHDHDQLLQALVVGRTDEASAILF